ncbi:MAG: TIGR04255 family protein [Bacteroidales bacterium]|nr:TIGR04255 family protein [Bacteroidales bacterium]
MNNLPFGAASYRQFETTFLASVIVGMKYLPVSDIDSCKKKWGEFTQSLFSIAPLEGIFEKPIVINRNDHKLSFIFEKNRAQVHIGGDGYQNFADTVIPQAYKLKRFVTEVANVEAPIGLGIRKIDVFQIETKEGNNLEEAAVRNHFFSREYCSLKDGEVKPDEEEKNFTGLKKHQWTENSNQLTLRSAFIKDPGASNRYRLVLDTDEQYSPHEGVKLDKLDEVLMDMNKDLFDAFMWCVSDSVIKFMTNGKE